MLAEEAIASAPDRSVYTADAHLGWAQALLHTDGTSRGEIESAHHPDEGELPTADHAP